MVGGLLSDVNFSTIFNQIWFSIIRSKSSTPTQPTDGLVCHG